jgi:signal transduction histidine kinase
MGLGLSEAFAVLDRMGAHIEIEPMTPTQGTRVSIYLPRSKASAKQGGLLVSSGPQGKGSAA